MASDGETSCANDPNFAAIYSFLKVFGKLQGLEPPTIVKLQEFLENTEEVSDALKELHLKLLRRALKSAHSDRWEKCMIKFCHQQGHHQEAWEIERFSYKKASTQVKLKVLKSAVNAIPSKELRLDPIGRDKNGCVYWLQVDTDANLSLYKEDQDEETWELIARNREELVKVIGQLKSGEEITPSSTCTDNEASSETEIPPEEPPKSEADEDNEDEFLSPESESEHEEIETHQNVQASETTPKEPSKSSNLDIVDNNEQIPEGLTKDPIKEIVTESLEEETLKTNGSSTEIENKPSVNESSKGNDSCPEAEISPEVNKPSNDENIHTEEINKEDTKNENIDCKNISIEDKQNVNIERNPEESLTDAEDEKIENHEAKNVGSNKEDNPEHKDELKELDESEEILNKKNETEEHNKGKNKDDIREQDEEVSEAIEDPLMVVTGEGNGTDCDSYFLGEEISEAVMYFYGEGCGYDNDTGNPEAITETNEADTLEENDGKELVNDSKDLVNGEHDVTNTPTKHRDVKLKSVSKRSLRKQPNDSNDANPDMKKPCVREVKSNCPNAETDLKREASVNDKSTTDGESPTKNKEARDSASPKKNNVKKRRSKVKKKAVARKIKVNEVKETINSVSETDNGQDKTSIIEKRKSSVSSVDEEIADESKENPDKEDPLAIEEPLPPKKSRLETTPDSDINATHSKDVSDAKEATSDAKDATSDGANETKDSISKRKKIKARKGKFKRKQKNKDVDKSNALVNDRSKKGSKSLKRSLVEATMSDKNKSESQSDSEDDEPITSGKRLKIKPKKIITSTRKKIEAKLLENHSSDESEEETLYSLDAKDSKDTKDTKESKDTKDPKDLKDFKDTKVSKDTKDLKAPKDSKDPKDKKSKAQSEDSDTPVRQSRRIAQLKIKEEAERRHQEEGKDDDEEEEWQASGRGSSSEEDKKRKHRKTWRTGKQPEWILLCDVCDAGYHASCLKPLLFYIPQGEWFCPPCNHEKLIESLESELVKFDALSVKVEEERARRKLEEPEPTEQVKVKKDDLR
ncbi:putative hepatitis B virus X associated protein, hbxa [Operophtera brumata]|uniref:Putative hepatitis B virus X associated protein, hbxa n=1 Tax=Operophtera brumata TaxID=104452 RepID=A0A0L7LK40_OPEBR|nr:putative hepatitis B virus X associated protein, hbxa [Operophtera brumata]